MDIFICVSAAHSILLTVWTRVIAGAALLHPAVVVVVLLAAQD